MRIRKHFCKIFSFAVNPKNRTAKIRNQTIDFVEQNHSWEVGFFRLYRDSLPFMQNRYSVSCLRKSATGSCHEPNASSL